MRRLLARPWAAVLLLAGAVALFLFPLARQPLAFPFSPGSAYSDALIAHLSSALFVQRAVETWGQIPLWNPTLLSGMPFAADPLSGLWYPPLWLLALAPSAAAINLLFWAHLVLGGLGMFLLLRAEGLGNLASLAGGLAFAGMPKLVGHVGLGHLTLVFAVCWSPWVLLSVGRAIDGLAANHWIRKFLLAGLLGGVVFVADPRWFVPTMLVAVAYGVWRWTSRPAGSARSIPRLLKGSAAAGIALAAVAAALALPLAEFVGLSTRASLTAAAADVYALPAEGLLGMLVVSRGARAEWMVSTGSVSLVLAAAGIGALWKRTLFWTGVFALALILALGQATPLGVVFSVLPGADLVRVPARWLFFSGMGTAALAAYGVAAVEGGTEGKSIRSMRLAALFVGAVVVAVSLGVGLISGEVSAWSALFAVLAVVVVSVGGRTPRPNWAAPLLTTLLVLELCWIDIPLNEARSADESLGAGRMVAAALSDDGDAGRIFSPSYAVPQEAAAAAGLALADGVHPLQLSSYVAFMAEAAGFPPETYSVTLPPFPSGDPTVDWGPELDAQALGLLGVGRIASTFPIEGAGLTFEKAIDGVFVYRNAAARPRAWVEAADKEALPVDSIDWTPNHVNLRASGPGLLVLGDPMYPGWRATIDGGEVPIVSYQGLLRSVDLPPGEHAISFRFLPISLLAGLAIGLGAAAVALVLWRRA